MKPSRLLKAARPGQLATVFLLICSAFLSPTNGLKCYACVSSGSLDPRCEKAPATVASGNPVVTCALKYCTTRRQEFLDPQGTVSSFYRGCEERPLYTNQVVTDGNLVTSYRACQTDLCNSDDGTTSTGAGGAGGGGGGGGWLDNGQWGGPDGGLVLAPGLGAAGAARVNSLLVVGAAALLIAVVRLQRGG